MELNFLLSLSFWGTRPKTFPEKARPCVVLSWYLVYVYTYFITLRTWIVCWGRKRVWSIRRRSWSDSWPIGVWTWSFPSIRISYPPGSGRPCRRTAAGCCLGRCSSTGWCPTRCSWSVPSTRTRCSGTAAGTWTRGRGARVPRNPPPRGRPSACVRRWTRSPTPATRSWNPPERIPDRRRPRSTTWILRKTHGFQFSFDPNTNRDKGPTYGPLQLMIVKRVIIFVFFFF